MTTPRIPERMQRTATRERSPPRLEVAGVARARVREREGKERERVGVMPRVRQRGG